MPILIRVKLSLYENHKYTPFIRMLHADNVAKFGWKILIWKSVIFGTLISKFSFLFSLLKISLINL